MDLVPGVRNSLLVTDAGRRHVKASAASVTTLRVDEIDEHHRGRNAQNETDNQTNIL